MILFWCVSFLVVLWLLIVILNAFSRPPENLGVTNDSLSPCPDSPNCVCSQDPSESHQIAPFPFTDSAKHARERLLTILRQSPGCTVMQADENYVRAEFRTRWLRFVDDVEFLIDARQNAIQVRSASRIGYSDLGANRQRVEALRRQFEQSSP